ncbi:class I SAM-dependent methyltransferase [Streptomyces fenghuangensis]|uniref:Class I SAM-dependent methyltransferase n=1 Tax=Streptomyces chitinivorans TaxID=1257027 RepID=A0ABW7HXY0_9ACTN|nr:MULTISPECIES: class I SAM-dependent methyltransferase [Streptomyces]MCG3044260.1 class I SAM-dependent methyltransferase [Streptomyces sp. ICN903]MDH2410585.1 class I SAM-dependent methyltransferase [Streptomyces chitinivorans]
MEDILEPPDLKAEAHPSRRFQERLLEDPEDRAAWQGLRVSYDRMAEEWREWTDEQRGYDLPVREGLRRVRPARWAVEICCGTGEATAAVASAVPSVVACDLSLEMLRRRVEVPGVCWVAADVRSLPLGTGRVPLVVSLNGVFNPSEIVRVLRPGGQLLWCTSFRAGTPLYVPPERMHRLLGEGWTAEEGRAGHGEWTLFTAPG